MIYTNPTAVSSAPLNTKDLESQNVIDPNQNPQKNRGSKLRKGAITLICATTAGVTLRALATQHFINSPLNSHTSRMLTPETGNSTCPDGFYRFDKASQLKSAKIAAGIGIGLVPGLGIASAAVIPFLNMDQECAVNTALFLAGTCFVGALSSIPITAIMLATAKSTEDGTCIEKRNNHNYAADRG